MEPSFGTTTVDVHVDTAEPTTMGCSCDVTESPTHLLALMPHGLHQRLNFNRVWSSRRDTTQDVCTNTVDPLIEQVLRGRSCAVVLVGNSPHRRSLLQEAAVWAAGRLLEAQRRNHVAQRDERKNQSSTRIRATLASLSGDTLCEHDSGVVINSSSCVMDMLQFERHDQPAHVFSLACERRATLDPESVRSSRKLFKLFTKYAKQPQRGCAAGSFDEISKEG